MRRPVDEEALLTLRLRADRLRNRGVVYVDEADAAALERLCQHVEREIARPHVDAVRLLRLLRRLVPTLRHQRGFRLIELVRIRREIAGAEEWTL